MRDGAGAIDSDDWPGPARPRVVPDPLPGTEPDLAGLSDLDRAELDQPQLDQPRSDNEAAEGDAAIDAALLGSPTGLGAPADSAAEDGDVAADVSFLLAYTGENADATTNLDPGETLLTSDDPATSTLARWWLPPA